MPGTLDALYKRYAYWLGGAAAFLLPLKLPLAYCALVPALVCLLLKLRDGTFRATLAPLKHIFVPLLLFIILAQISSLFGINPLRSTEKLIGLTFFALSIVFYFDIVREHGYSRILTALFAGQSIASLHSVLNGAFPELLPVVFPGQVTESGQLAISLTMATGMALYLSSEINGGNRPAFSPAKSADLVLWGITNFFLLSILAFAPTFHLHGIMVTTLLVISLASLVLAVIMPLRAARSSGNERSTLLILLMTVVLPLFSAALMVNLKRGPWAGVLISSLLLLFLYGRKFLVPTLLLVLALIFYVEPVYTRLQDAPDHFFIAGGRARIWEIGAELVTRYPLGIGFKNSNFLRSFSPDIPPQLVHFHSNLLNVAAETGWIALMAYIWWIASILRLAFHRPFAARESILISALGAAVLAWQVAGAVEYNFGDSEVLLVAYLTIGTLAGLLSRGGQRNEHK